MSDTIIFTPDEVAKELKIAKNTVYELIKRGELPAYKVGRQVRIDSNDLDLYKQKGKTAATSAPPVSNIMSPSTSATTHEQLIISGQDALLDILANCIQNHPSGTTVLRSHVDSFTGLISLYYDQCHIAATHLYDFSTRSYNVTYVEKLLPGISCVILRLASRMQGFYVRKGNPKKITNWVDLTQDSVTFINREKGSGTRVLLDQHLQSLLIPSKTINGYLVEETSPLNIANAIINGRADVGIGFESTIKLMNQLEFVPLQKENYDLVIKKEALDDPMYRLVFDIINSEKFKNSLQNLSDYDISELGSIVAET